MDDYSLPLTEKDWELLMVGVEGDPTFNEALNDAYKKYLEFEQGEQA